MNTNSSTGEKFPVNIPVPERLVSLAIGGALMYKGLTGRKKLNTYLTISGALFLFRAATGYSSIYTIAGKKKLRDTVRNVNIKVKMTVGRPRQELYDFWRNLSNLPLFMKHLEKVEVVDAKRSHWKAKVPGGLGSIDWQAEIVKDIPGEMIGWNSLPYSQIQNAGKVEFRDNGNSTDLRVIISYRAPLGDVGEGIAALFNPLFKKLIKNDIKSFKSYMEKP